MERHPYTDKEKTLLVTLVQKYKDIIENKTPDATIWLAKQAAWEEVTKEFNNRLDVIQHRRDPKQLRKLWENLKQKRKREKIAERQRASLIETGPPSKQNRFEGDDVVDIIVVPDLDLEIPNKWDSIKLEKNDLKQDETQKSSSSGEDTSFLVSSTSRNFSFNRKKHTDREKELRILKLEEAIAQQRELHQIKMEAAITEAQYHKVRLENEKRKCK